MIPIQQFACKIDPSYKEDPARLQSIHSAAEPSLWFKIDPATKRLVLPSMNKLRVNYILLDKTIESIITYRHMNFQDPKYDWDKSNIRATSYTEPEEALSALEELLETPPVLVACDIETRDVSWDGNCLLAIGIAVSQSEAITFSGKALEDTEVFKLLKQFLGSSSTRFIWHNGKFDIGRLAHLCGIQARVDEDTMLMHYIMINETRGTHGLKDLAPLYLQAPQWDDQLQNFKRKWCRLNKVKVGDFTYDMIPTDMLLPYLAMDCIATYRLFEEFNRVGDHKKDWIYRQLVRASNIYSQIECNGIQVDTKYLQSLRKELEAELAEAKVELDTAIVDIWNPEQYMKETGAKSCNKGVFTHKSPKQLKWVIEKAVGHAIADTSAATLEELGEKTPFLKALAKVRKCNKYLDTYISGYEELMGYDDRIRCSYNLHGTETGRLSCSDPK